MTKRRSIGKVPAPRTDAAHTYLRALRRLDASPAVISAAESAAATCEEASSSRSFRRTEVVTGS